MTTGSLIIDPYLSLLDAVAVPLLVIRQGRVHWLNHNAQELLQRQPEELRTQPITTLFASDYTDLIRLTLDAALRTQAPLTVVAPLNIHTQQGAATTWMRVTISPSDQLKPDERLLTLASAQPPLSEPLHPDVDQLPHGVYMTSVEGQLLYANPAAFRIYGYSNYADFERVAAQKVSTHYDNPAEREQIVQRWLATPGYSTAEYQALRADGTKFWVRDTGRAVRDAQGRVLRFEGAITDITLEKTQQAQITARNQELETLNAIARTISSSLDVDTILEHFLVGLQSVVPYTSSSIFLYVDDKAKVYSYRNLPDIQEVEAHMGFFRDDPITQQVFESEQPLIIPDTQQNPDWVRLPTTAYIRCWMGVPLLHQGKTIGLLNLDHAEPNFYQAHHARNAFALAQQASVVISNARLYQQAQTELAQRTQAQAALSQALQRTQTLYNALQLLINADLLDEVLAQVLAMLCDTLSAAGGLLVAFDDSVGSVNHYIELGVTGGWQDFWQLVGDTSRTEPGLPDYDLRWPQALQRTLVDGRHVCAASVGARGALLVVRAAEASPFAEDDGTLLGTLAHQLTIALENNMLWHQLQQYSLRLALMLDERTQQLKQERAQLQAILDATGEGILYMEDFAFKYANPALCHMLRYSQQELVGQQLSFIRADAPEDDTVSASDDPYHIILGNLSEMNRDETRLRRRDGSTFFASLTFTMIGNPGDQPVRMVVVVRDVSQDHELHAQRARFIDNAAHELRTPLTSLGLRLQLLQRQPERLETHLKPLYRAYNNMKLLVDDMLNLTRFEKTSVVVERRAHNLQPLLEDAAKLAERQGQQRRIKRRFAKHAVLAYVDADRIQQMMQALLRDMLNEIDADDQLVLTLDIQYRASQNYARITVHNPIRRFPSDLLPTQIFEAFSWPRLGASEGTGIELAIVNRIVALHGGVVRASNQPEGGSSISILLPYREGA